MGGAWLHPSSEDVEECGGVMVLSDSSPLERDLPLGDLLVVVRILREVGKS